MMFKMARNDIARQKTVTFAILSLITLSALLLAVGARILVDLSGSIDSLVEASRAPHFIQFHTGPFDEAAVRRFAESEPLVEDLQIVDMVTVQEADLFFEGRSAATKGGVMELGFVRQNPRFDLLLDLQNRPLVLSPGEIAVPVFYLRREGLKVGDQVRLAIGEARLEFRIAAFVRDVQMNPSFVSSKRFLVSDADYGAVLAASGEIERIVEFRLRDLGAIAGFRDRYAAAGLPQRGPTIELAFLRLANGLTDGFVVAALAFCGLVLCLVAALCLRFAIAASIEEEYREIGAMKGIGLPAREIGRLYAGKYLLLLSLGGLAGCAAAPLVGRAFLGNMLDYLGPPPGGAAAALVPPLAVILPFAAVYAACLARLARVGRISAVEAISAGLGGEAAGRARGPRLRGRAAIHPNFFLALKDAARRPRSYALLFACFAAAAFAALMPALLLDTIGSPDFVRYMGFGSGDLLVDLRQTEGVRGRFEAAVAGLGADAEVAGLSPRVTCRFEARDGAGEATSLAVETGDFSTFGVEYLEGAAPLAADEIALSALAARELGKAVGDELSLAAGGRELVLRVSGLYQDLSNGGRGAKAPLPPDYSSALWYTIYVDLREGADIAAKAAEYAAAYGPAKVADVAGYVRETFGSTVDQLRLAAAAALLAALAVTALVSALFARMLASRDVSEIAVQRCLGFSARDIRAQYLARALLVLAPGAALGGLLSGALGGALASAAMSSFGIERLELVVDPRKALLIPLLLVCAGALAALASLWPRGEFRAADVSIE